jgi:putative RecB family exonuclease
MPEYSISQIGKFEQCALQYKFIYIDRIKRYEEGVEAFLGSRFHEAMEWLYRERAFRIVPLEELLDCYEKSWAGNWHAEVKIRKEGRTADDYRLLGRRFIEDYYKRHDPFDEGRVLGLERFIRFPLDDEGRYICKGVIDRLMLAPDGAFEVHDYKTGSNLPEQQELDEDRQLALYQIGVQKLWPDAKEVRLVWHLVAFGLEMRSLRTPEALEKLKGELARLIDRIEAEREFAPYESALCDWCPYWDLCPVKKHLVKVEALPKD